ncbi:YkgJ family cysteine cluster protein, partial [Dehalococcoides sp.]|uniref:YkgJ family cysteine cluster protein n=1 Tax=Dehalococcoides sp. TaxID=1966486 RepID=UPI00356A3876
MNDIENTDIFECRRCGNCCLHFQPHLEMAEAQNIADHLSLSLDEFKAKYADKRWPGHRTMLIRHNQNGCIFMEHGVD